MTTPEIVTVVKPKSCATCKWWVSFGDKGYCHKYAPSPVSGKRNEDISLPITEKDGWCGDFE